MFLNLDVVAARGVRLLRSLIEARHKSGCQVHYVHTESPLNLNNYNCYTYNCYSDPLGWDDTNNTSEFIKCYKLYINFSPLLE